MGQSRLDGRTDAHKQDYYVVGGTWPRGQGRPLQAERIGWSSSRHDTEAFSFLPPPSLGSVKSNSGVGVLRILVSCIITTPSPMFTSVKGVGFLDFRPHGEARPGMRCAADGRSGRRGQGIDVGAVEVSMALCVPRACARVCLSVWMSVDLYCSYCYSVWLTSWGWNSVTINSSSARSFSLGARHVIK